MTYREAKDILDKFSRIPHTPRIIASAYPPWESKPKVFQRKEAPETRFHQNCPPTDSINSTQRNTNNASPSTARTHDDIPAKPTPQPIQQQRQTPSKPSR